MSFYDDASLVFLPSGGAGKDGKAYSIKPVPEYGNELVTNGGFDTDSDWTKTNATISGGVATITSTGYAYAAVVQTNVLTIGKTYKATIDVNSIVGGLIVGTSETITNSGIASVTFTATNTYLDIRRDSSFATTTAVIDNVSVKEVIVDGDFTFSRGGNLTATRVDSNGLIEKGRENLLKQSNQFDTTWVTSGSPSLSSGQSGYDGSTDAWLYTNNGSEYIYQDETTNVATYSIFAKKGNGGIGDFVLLFTDGVGGRYFDLDNGVLGSEVLTGLIDSKIELVSGTTDWYRCSITFASSTRVRVYASLADNDFASVASIYIQDAQLEIGLVATEYIESGATTGKAGILEHSPRFDYSGGASCASLLLEPSRTQLVTQSEYFESSDWDASPSGVGIAADITTNYATSPEGLQNATRLRLDLNGGTTATDRSRIKGDFGIGSSGSQAHSIYIKSNDGVTQNITFRSLGTLTNHEITSNWKRIDLLSTDNSLYFELGIYGNTSYNDTADLLIWGAQVEEASYPTSYIPNHSGGSVTRNGENKYLQNSSILSSGDGTIFWELDEFDTNTSADGFNQIIYVSKNSDSSLNDTIYLDEYIGNFRIYIRKNNILILRSETGYADLRGSKIAISWNSSGAKIFIDGVENASYVGDASNTFEFFGHDRPYNDAIKSSLKLKQEMYFPTALSDADCITLTS